MMIYLKNVSTPSAKPKTRNTNTQKEGITETLKFETDTRELMIKDLIPKSTDKRTLLEVVRDGNHEDYATLMINLKRLKIDADFITRIQQYRKKTQNKDIKNRKRGGLVHTKATQRLPMDLSMDNDPYPPQLEVGELQPITYVYVPTYLIDPRLFFWPPVSQQVEIAAPTGTLQLPPSPLRLSPPLPSIIEVAREPQFCLEDHQRQEYIEKNKELIVTLRKVDSSVHHLIQLGLSIIQTTILYEFFQKREEMEPILNEIEQHVKPLLTAERSAIFMQPIIEFCKRIKELAFDDPGKERFFTLIKDDQVRRIVSAQLDLHAELPRE